jgi:hypothetical protein
VFTQEQQKTVSVTGTGSSVTQQPHSLIINTTSHTNMTTQSTTAVTTTTATLSRKPVANVYWKSVKLCVAKPDVSSEIHRQHGRVGADGRARHSKTDSVTVDTDGITHFEMKPKIMKIATYILAGVLPFIYSRASADETPVQPAQQGLVSVIIDDQTGEELARDHGIQAVEVADLDGLLNAVIQGQKPVRLQHIAVDEDSTDNAVATMTFRPYAGGKPPQAPGANLPLRQLSEEMKRYRIRRAEWQRGLIEYRGQVQGEVEGFVRQVTATQLEVSERFDKKLAARNGRDFNRSDVVKSIEMANKLLKDSAHPVLVLNTDGIDLPSEQRKPQNQPLTVEQLDPKIMLIFVNTSRRPEQSALFRGLRNETRHADNVKEAMSILIDQLNKDDANAEQKSEKE